MTDSQPDAALSNVTEDLQLTPQERVHLAERLWAEAQQLYPHRARHVAVSFSSFEEFEAWRLAQDRPWLY